MLLATLVLHHHRRSYSRLGIPPPPASSGEIPLLDLDTIAQGLSIGSLIYITIFELMLPVAIEQKSGKPAAKYTLELISAMSLGIVLVAAFQLSTNFQEEL